jgi:hypothetical protein
MTRGALIFIWPLRPENIPYMGVRFIMGLKNPRYARKGDGSLPVRIHNRYTTINNVSRQIRGIEGSYNVIAPTYRPPRGLSTFPQALLRTTNKKEREGLLRG